MGSDDCLFWVTGGVEGIHVWATIFLDFVCFGV